MKIQIIGPYFTNYSLARVNRQLGIALKNLGYNVGLWCDEQDIDYLPSKTELEKKNIKEIVFLHSDPEVSIYNNFPKSIHNKLGLEKLNGKLKFAFLAWEESVYPSHWVDEINHNLHGVFVSSSFVKEIFLNNGIKIPIFVLHLGFDLEKVQPKYNFSLKTKKKFKFLHISTLKERKGGDKLIDAYLSVFTKQDDVVLVIKTSNNLDNRIIDLISKKNSNNSPEIEVLEQDLSDEEIASLHNLCHVEVYPSRTEGFGLPLLGSLYYGNPLIATAYSGYMDFVGDHNAYLVDYTLQKAINSDLGLIGSVWAEPDIEDLKSKMKYIYQLKEDIFAIKNSLKNNIKLNNQIANQEIYSKVINGLNTSKMFTWENTALNLVNYLQHYFNASIHLNTQNQFILGVVTTYNDSSGISEYSSDIFTPIKIFFKDIYFFPNKDVNEKYKEDDDNILRTWQLGNDDSNELIEKIKEKKIDILHIQYHSGQMSIELVKNLFKFLSNSNIRVYITFHNLSKNSLEVIDIIKKQNCVKQVFIHSNKDYEFLTKIIGLKDVSRLYIPTNEPVFHSKSIIRKHLGIDKYSPIICTHGLLNVNKNIPNVIKAIEILKDKYPKILLLLLNAVSEDNIFASSLSKEIDEYISTYRLEDNIIKISKFLSSTEVITLISACDIAIYAYSEVGESASGAINKAFSSNTPSIVTDIPTFKEYTNEVFKIKDCKPESIANGIEKLLRDENLKLKQIKSSMTYTCSISKDLISLKMMQTYLNPIAKI